MPSAETRLQTGGWATGPAQIGLPEGEKRRLALILSSSGSLTGEAPRNQASLLSPVDAPQTALLHLTPADELREAIDLTKSRAPCW